MNRAACCAAALGLLALAHCGSEPSNVNVDMSLALATCEDEAVCGAHHRTVGVAADSGESTGDELATAENQLVIYADFDTDSGAVAILEIAVLGGGEGAIRYHEVTAGNVTFDGEIQDHSVEIHRTGDTTDAAGSFSFFAVDGEQVRQITDGRVWPVDPPLAAPPSPTPAPRRPLPPSTPRPRRPDHDVDVDVHVVSVPEGGGCGGEDVDTGSGCEGDSTDSGCESSGDAGSGCEGSSDAGSGCEGDAAGSGCEGGADAAGSCGGCEGTSIARARPRRRAGSMFRLAWPVFLAAAFNRRLRRR